MWRWRVSGRSIPAALALLLVVPVSCADDGPPTAAPDPLAEHVDEAIRIAGEEWFGFPWVVQHANSRYRLDGDELVLEDHAYVLITTDGSNSYYLVRFHADDTVSTGPVAGLSVEWVAGFDFAENSITSIDATHLAWDRLGSELVDRCGAPQWLDVRGSRSESGEQRWSVEYSTRGETHTVWFDAASGDVVEVREEPCDAPSN